MLRFKNSISYFNPKSLSIPIHPLLKKKEINKIIKILNFAKL